MFESAVNRFTERDVSPTRDCAVSVWIRSIRMTMTVNTVRGTSRLDAPHFGSGHGHCSLYVAPGLIHKESYATDK